MLLKILRSTLTCIVFFLIAACGEVEPIVDARYVQADALIEKVKSNISAAGLVEVADIDHSRLAHEAGSPMPPARVVIFSDTTLETQLIQVNPLLALDLPLRVLAFEDKESESSRVIYNSFDYLVSRYQLNISETLGLRNSYIKAMNAAVADIEPVNQTVFQNDAMQPAGIITLDSPFGFEETINRVNAAIDSQGDTVHFGAIDFQANALANGIEISPSYMILFGGPGPGGDAMANAPTLGLDAFCQKFLIWQDAEGKTHLSFNDLLSLADRQQVPKALVLRVIDFRLSKTFEDALSKD
jgi:uncharacterized protein (DUF302 family)